ncbi:MAG: mechanosensitive ion channel family protein, partial [Planctomycetota bacterium]
IEELRGEKAALVERLRIVLDAIETKGGDQALVDELRSYSAAVTATSIVDPTALDVTDVGSLERLYEQAEAWVISPTGGVAVGLNILRFLGILIAFWLVSRVIGRATRMGLKKFKRASSLLKQFVVGSVKRVTMLIGLIVALDNLGVDIGPLVAAIGAAGLVIGFALQGTLSNFASGLLILFYKPFDIGNVVTVGGVSGSVQSMTLVSTLVKTFDNQLMYVPNNEVWNNVITNATGQDTRRVDLVIGIDYASDMASAERILSEIVAGHPKVLQDPAPVIKVHELADSSVNFIVRPWSKTSDYWDVYWDVTRQAKERFDAAGIGIPFPQQDVHVPGPIEVVVKNG